MAIARRIPCIEILAPPLKLWRHAVGGTLRMTNMNSVILSQQAKNLLVGILRFAQNDKRMLGGQRKCRYQINYNKNQNGVEKNFKHIQSRNLNASHNVLKIRGFAVSPNKTKIGKNAKDNNPHNKQYASPKKN